MSFTSALFTCLKCSSLSWLSYNSL